MARLYVQDIHKIHETIMGTWSLHDAAPGGGLPIEGGQVVTQYKSIPTVT